MVDRWWYLQLVAWCCWVCDWRYSSTRSPLWNCQHQQEVWAIHSIRMQLQLALIEYTHTIRHYSLCSIVSIFVPCLLKVSLCVIVTTHVLTAHYTQDGALVLIQSCQTNSIHNTGVLEAIHLIEREAMHGTIRYRGQVTYGGHEVPGCQSKVLGHPHWLNNTDCNKEVAYWTHDMCDLIDHNRQASKMKQDQKLY